MKPSRRSSRQGNTAIALLAAAALLGFGNYFAIKYWKQWDWTSGGLYTISDRTRSVLQAIDKPVRLVSFLGDRQRPEVDSILHEIRMLAGAYQTAGNGKVSFEHIDVDRDWRRAQELLGKFGLDPQKDSIDLIVVASGDRTKQVKLDDMVEFEREGMPGGAPMVRALRAEESLTAAILSVTRAKKPKIVFASGHGERLPSDSQPTGLSRWNEQLGHADIETGSWPAFGSNKLPEGADLIVVAGPTHAWLPPESEALGKYLDAGGRAMLLLDPTLARADSKIEATGLEELCRKWGVELENDIVIDPDRATPFFGAETFHAQLLGLHPVTSHLADQPVLLSLARSLKLTTDHAGILTSTLAESSTNSWGETALDKLDQVQADGPDPRGPLPLIVAAEKKGGQGDRPGRLLIAGDADLAANLAFPAGSNADLVQNSVAWLLDEQQSLGITPKDRSLTRLLVSEQQKDWLLWLLVGGLPAICVGTGLSVWWQRRAGAPR